MNKRAIGSHYEELAAERLEKMGYRILCRNYRCRTGEIDLVAEQGGYLVFIEVKYRADGQDGEAAEAVDARKQRRIIQTSKRYLMERHVPEDRACRYDVVAVDGDQVRIIQDAFWT